METYKQLPKDLLRDLWLFFYHNQYDEEKYPHFRCADLIREYDPEIDDMRDMVVFYNY